jgi:hypothetical protein
MTINDSETARETVWEADYRCSACGKIEKRLTREWRTWLTNYCATSDKISREYRVSLPVQEKGPNSLNLSSNTTKSCLYEEATERLLKLVRNPPIKFVPLEIDKFEIEGRDELDVVEAKRIIHEVLRDSGVRM